MHREFDPTESPFTPRTNASLYALTALLGGLLAADLWPVVAGWLGGLGLGPPTWQTREVYGFRFALIAAVLGGARVLYGSLEQLSAGKVGADLAVAVAAIAAILIGEPLVAAEVVFIGLVGECLEAWTFDRTQRAIRGLAELFPMRCWVLRNGDEVRAFTAELVVGDTVVVKPGGKVPADGVVLDGTSAVDTSALTGESVPVDKAPGDVTLAGSVVQFGSLTIRVDKVATETVAGQVAALTAAAKTRGPANARPIGWPGTFCRPCCSWPVSPSCSTSTCKRARRSGRTGRSSPPGPPPGWPSTRRWPCSWSPARARWCWPPRRRWSPPSAGSPGPASWSRAGRPSNGSPG